jgi:ferric-dicitrate binding protein FerR (iron transport regulator)
MTIDRDETLSQRLAETLERSLDTIDADALAQLANARRHALDRRKRTRQVIGGFALAAGIAAIAVLPWLSRPAPHDIAQDQSYLTVDPQLLADMDMLEVIGIGDMSLDAGGA